LGGSGFCGTGFSGGTACRGSGALGFRGSGFGGTCTCDGFGDAVRGVGTVIGSVVTGVAADAG
jgi:hypothetical protein